MTEQTVPSVALPTISGIPPLLVDAEELGRLLSVSKGTIRRMDAAGKLPAPIKLSGGTVRWGYEELRAWVAAGCPDRSTWNALSKEVRTA